MSDEVNTTLLRVVGPYETVSASFDGSSGVVLCIANQWTYKWYRNPWGTVAVVLGDRIDAALSAGPE